jgi:hypothetical protein
MGLQDSAWAICKRLLEVYASGRSPSGAAVAVKRGMALSVLAMGGPPSIVVDTVHP